MNKARSPSKALRRRLLERRLQVMRQRLREERRQHHTSRFRQFRHQRPFHRPGFPKYNRHSQACVRHPSLPRRSSICVTRMTMLLKREQSQLVSLLFRAPRLSNLLPGRRLLSNQQLDMQFPQRPSKKCASTRHLCQLSKWAHAPSLRLL